MYKRINKKGLLGLISSFLGVFSICGLISLGLFSKPKVIQKVSATDIDLLQTSGQYHFQVSYNRIDSDLNIDYTYTYDAYFLYNLIYSYSTQDSVNEYQFTLRFSMYFDENCFDNDEQYYLTPHRYILNYKDENDPLYKSNPTVNNLPHFTVYSAESRNSTNHLDFAFLGFIDDSSTTELGNTLFRFPDADYFNGTLLIPSTLYVADLNNNGSIIAARNEIARVRNAMNYNQGFERRVINDDFTYSTSTYEDGYMAGYSVGYNDGYNQGQQSGNNQGYQQGYEYGYNSALENIDNELQQSYAQGYSVGFEDASTQNQTALTILNGIVTVGLLPIKFFLSIFNFEILGINIAGFVSALLSICVIIIVWKTIMGGKSSD